MAQKPLFLDKRVGTVAEYVDVLSKIPRDRILWFRGQSNARWKLVPSLARLRGNRIADEAMLMKRFRQSASALVPLASRTEWDWLLLMQHHGVPTRLLDWTENALAGLYFAAVSTGGQGARNDGCVWALDPVALNGEANIAVANNDIPTLDVDVVLREYQPSEVASAVNVRPPVAVLAMRMFPRLVAQSGVFTLIHRDRTPLEEVRASAYVGRIVVPKAAKPLIARQLSDVGVTRLSLFPELESVAVLVKSFLR